MNSGPTAAEVKEYILANCAGVQTEHGMGYDFFYTSDDHTIPFATIGTGDAVDQYSNLSREGVYRLNLGIGKATFQSRFAEDGEYDYTVLDRVMPHPEYAKMFYVCVLNPSTGTFANEITPLIREAYELKTARMARR